MPRKALISRQFVAICFYFLLAAVRFASADTVFTGKAANVADTPISAKSSSLEVDFGERALLDEREEKAKRLGVTHSSASAAADDDTRDDGSHSSAAAAVDGLGKAIRHGGFVPISIPDHEDADGNYGGIVNGFDFLTRTFLTRKAFQIKCCRGGVPIITQPDLVRNFTYHAAEYVTDESDAGGGELAFQPEPIAARSDATVAVGGGASSALGSGAALNCRVFYGIYYTPPAALLNIELSYQVQVVCKCPDIGPGHQMDKNCRRLPTCKNNGFRSSIDPQKCLCLQPFFGEKCEKFCDRGQRLRGLNGRDYCSCSPFYKGDECRDVVCLNGGREESGRCICAPQYLGYHCEIDTNRTAKAAGGANFGEFGGGGIRVAGGGSESSRFQRFGDQVSSDMFTRDISGTIFSLIMIIVLVVSMYLLMKHRMQARYLSRRPDLLGACNFPGAPAFGGGVPLANSTARRVELMPTFDDAIGGGAATSARTFPFRNFVGSLASSFIPGDGGPPPYIPPGQRGRRNRDDILPPLPSYEDATKLPPLRQNVGDQIDGETISNDHAIEMVSRTRNTAAEIRPVDNLSSPAIGSPPSTSSTPERRHRAATRRTHDEAANAVLRNGEAQESVSLRSDESIDDDKMPPTTNAMTIQRTGSKSSQHSRHSSPSINADRSSENNQSRHQIINNNRNNQERLRRSAEDNDAGELSTPNNQSVEREDISHSHHTAV